MKIKRRHRYVLKGKLNGWLKKLTVVISALAVTICGALLADAVKARLNRPSYSDKLTITVEDIKSERASGGYEAYFANKKAATKARVDEHQQIPELEQLLAAGAYADGLQLVVIVSTDQPVEVIVTDVRPVDIVYEDLPSAVIVRKDNTGGGGQLNRMGFNMDLPAPEPMVVEDTGLTDRPYFAFEGPVYSKANDAQSFSLLFRANEKAARFRIAISYRIGKDDYRQLVPGEFRVSATLCEAMHAKTAPSGRTYGTGLRGSIEADKAQLVADQTITDCTGNE